MRYFLLSVLSTALAAPGQIGMSVWQNTAFNPPDAASTSATQQLNLSNFVSDYSSVRIQGQINTAAPDLITFTVVHDGAVRLWVDDHLTVDDGPNPSAGPHASVAFQNISFTGSGPVSLRLDYMHYTAVSTLQLYWHGNHTPYSLVPSTALYSDISPGEQQRIAMKGRLENPPVAWQTFNRPSMGTHVHMPSGFGLDAQLADLTTGETTGAIILYRVASPAVVLPGYHSWNGSDYTQFTIAAWKRLNCTVSIETSTSANGQDLYYLADSTGPDCARLALLVQPSMYWQRYGTFAQDPTSHVITATVPGFNTFTVYPLAGATTVPFPNATSPSYYAFPLGAGVVGLSTGQAYPLPTMQAAITAGAAYMASLPPQYGDLSFVYDAASSVLAWNTVYTPYEGVITPVSRGWGTHLGNGGYVLFEWDNLLAGFMAALRGGIAKDIAYSNIIQILLARTTAGFVPNYQDGMYASTDRSEPQIGAYVVQQVYNKWKEAWLVEVTFEALLSWNDWVWDRRRGEGVYAGSDGRADLIVLGSDCNAPHVGSGCGDLPSARLESGLDNSPLYDGADTAYVGPVTYNVSTGHMALYDVGATALYLSDTQALIALAAVIGRGHVVPLLQDRFDRVSSALNEYMWDDVSSAYTNVLYNGSFYRRHAPTSFFPLLSGVVPDDRAAAMMDLLTSPLGFCVNATWAPVPGGSSDMLSQWYDGAHDHALCLSAGFTTAVLEHQYVWARVEAQALLPTASQPGDVALYHWFCPTCAPGNGISNGNGDHALTADGLNPPVPAVGYVLLGQEGSCFSTPAAAAAASPTGWATTNLTLWYSAGKADSYTCGTAACVAYAQANGYIFVSTLCYAWDASTPETLPCKYGGNSIARSDPSFFDNYYWRGRIWGPHLQLLYWGLRQYDHLPTVRAARQVLVQQGAALLQLTWGVLKQVPENYHGLIGYPEDGATADPFYHWGALSGFLGLLEQGYY